MYYSSGLAETGAILYVHLSNTRCPDLVRDAEHLAHIISNDVDHIMRMLVGGFSKKSSQ